MLKAEVKNVGNMQEFLLCPQMTERQGSLRSLFYKGTNPLYEGSTLMI